MKPKNPTNDRNKGARKVITRSKKTFRLKYPSLKNHCSIYCESILEAETARFLEISYFVKNYKSQPRKEIYYGDDGQPREYFPDFEVTLIDDSILDIETKPQAKLRNPTTKGKYEAIARRYEEQGRTFRIVTDKTLRSEPLLGNLKLIDYHLPTTVSGKDINGMKQKLSQSDFYTVAHATAILGNESHVYSLIGVGYLATDFNQPICLTSPIWIRNSTNGGENDPLRV